MTIEEIFSDIKEYFKSFYHNPDEGWYEFEIGIPISWIYQNDSESVDIEIINENEIGRVLKISPKSNDTTADDLKLFIKMLIDANKAIELEKEEFDKKIAEMKKTFAEEIQKQQQKLTELKSISIKTKKNNLSVNSSEPKTKTSKKTKVEE